MVIGQFNTYPHGGAFMAAHRIHQQLRADGVDSRFYYRYADRPAPHDDSCHRLEFSPPSTWWQSNPIAREASKRRRRRIHRSYDRHLAPRRDQVSGFTMAELPDPTSWNVRDLGLDVVHLHGVGHFLDYPSFFQSIPRGMPIVWTLHDMFPFTGGCHYSAGCTRFQQKCGACPILAEPGLGDASQQAMIAKQRALRGHRLQVVAPSQWILEQAKKSPIWPASTCFFQVRYGLDLHQFSPRPKLQAKQSLGISPEKVLIGFGADNLADPRKGLAELGAAIRQLPPDPQLEFGLFGQGQLPPELLAGRRVHSFGFVSDPIQQSQIYSACDCVVLPSREDNQPSVGLESLACGTPLVGCRAGGIPEFVIPGATGLLVEPGNVQQLRDAVQWMWAHPEARRHMGERGRLMMLRDFEIVQQARQVRNVYLKALSEWDSSRSQRAA